MFMQYVKIYLNNWTLYCVSLDAGRSNYRPPRRTIKRDASACEDYGAKHVLVHEIKRKAIGIQCWIVMKGQALHFFNRGKSYAATAGTTAPSPISQRR